MINSLSIHWDKNEPLTALGLRAEKRTCFLCVHMVYTFSPRCFLSTSLHLPFRDGWSWEKAQSCTTGAEDGSEQSRHRESCHRRGSQGFTQVFTMRTVTLLWNNSHRAGTNRLQIWAIRQTHVGVSYQRLLRISALQNLQGFSCEGSAGCVVRSFCSHWDHCHTCLYYGLCRHHQKGH